MTGLPGWARGGYGYPALPWWTHASASAKVGPADELEALKAQAKFFRKTLEDISSRIEQIENTKQEMS
jgi:hypothetical protein